MLYTIRYTPIKPSLAMFILMFGFILSTTFAQSEQVNLKPNPLAEQWILKQVSVGEDADLEKRFSQEKDRVIRASFLENLLTNSPNAARVHRRGVHIVNAIISGEINLHNAKIPYAASLENCLFVDPVNYLGANIDGDLSFDGSNFKGGADFEDIIVSGDAFFRNATFEASAIFLGASVSRNFEASGSKFKGSEAPAVFEDLQVKGNAYFGSTEFEGPAIFRGANIGGNLGADGIQFRNKDKSVEFDGVQVDKYALFRDAVFEGPVNFLNMGIGKTLDADRTHFKSSANFEGIKVDGSALFRNTVFQGPSRFFAANISRTLETGGAQFKDTNDPANFEDLKTDTIYLGYAFFAGKPRFGGITYRHIEAGSWDNLLNLINKSAYSVDVYAGVESMHQREGYPNRAKEVYIAQKRRERSEHLRGVSWLGSLLLDVLVGYGRRPWLALIYSAIVIGIGCIVFRSKSVMEPQKPEHKSLRYNPFWYSLDLFLPFIDLQVDSVWAPKQEHRFARNYMYVHTILGWVLIPVGLAALTGIIK